MEYRVAEKAQLGIVSAIENGQRTHATPSSSPRVCKESGGGAACLAHNIKGKTKHSLGPRFNLCGNWPVWCENGQKVT